MIPLRRALRLGASPQIAFVGAGGKTSALFALAREFEKPVLVTTATHFAIDQLTKADSHIVFRNQSEVNQMDLQNLAPVTALIGAAGTDGRVSGPSEESLLSISEFARSNNLPLLIEADGARRLALKAPGNIEPAIPAFVDAVVVVAGLCALGKPLISDTVHRPEIFASLSGLAMGEVVTTVAAAKMLLHPEGGLKNIPPSAKRFALLNQADTLHLEAAAGSLAPALLTGYDAVLVAALQHSSEIKTVHERVAGIVLAAGGSARLGRSKQLLDWRGKPFVRQVAETALAAGLDPVVVVTGANAAETEAALSGSPVRIVRNEDWASGQSESVKTGLASLPANVGAALFLVVDQPQLPVALIQALRAEHAATLAPIVAPLVDGNRSNPVLFDRSTFADFAKLEGDVGGRAIFAKHQVTWVPWLDASISIDVDKPEDYDRLLRQAG
jgi:molybdenum cofactor cytidylyltransferase